MAKAKARPKPKVVGKAGKRVAAGTAIPAWVKNPAALAQSPAATVSSNWDSMKGRTGERRRKAKGAVGAPPAVVKPEEVWFDDVDPEDVVGGAPARRVLRCRLTQHADC